MKPKRDLVSILVLVFLGRLFLPIANTGVLPTLRNYACNFMHKHGTSSNTLVPFEIIFGVGICTEV
jgi:hypothetical protein